MKPRALCFLAFTVLALTATAQTPEPAPAVPTPATPPTAVERDPFWPPGYTPAAAVPVTSGPETPAVSPVVAPVAPTNAAPAAADPPANPDVPNWPVLRVKAWMVTPRGDQVPLIEGAGVVEIGQKFEVKSGGFRYRYRVDAIRPDKVLYTQLEAIPIGR